MTDLSSQVLSRMKDFHLEPLSLVDDLILPYYEGLSLVNIPVTITRLLGVPDFGKMPLDELILRPLGGGYKKVLVLLYNVNNFYSLYPELNVKNKLDSKNILDLWVVSRVNKLVRDVTKSLESYDTISATNFLKIFVDELSTWYVRRSRDRFNDGDFVQIGDQLTEGQRNPHDILRLNGIKACAQYLPWS